MTRLRSSSCAAAGRGQKTEDRQMNSEVGMRKSELDRSLQARCPVPFTFILWPLAFYL